MATPSINQVRSEVSAHFPSVTLSADVAVCRRIADSNRWSQHAWNNAVDIHVPDQRTGDAVYSWLVANKNRIGLATICWQNHGGCNAADHQDHVHVDGLPTKTGTPPCAKHAPSYVTQQSENIATPGELVGSIPFFGSVIKAGASAGSNIHDVASFVEALGKGETWLRVLWFTTGTIAALGGVWIFVKQATGIDIPVGKIATTVAKAAA